MNGDDSPWPVDVEAHRVGHYRRPCGRGALTTIAAITAPTTPSTGYTSVAPSRSAVTHRRGFDRVRERRLELDPHVAVSAVRWPILLQAALQRACTPFGSGGSFVSRVCSITCTSTCASDLPSNSRLPVSIS
jgi:hypothetical protein